MEDEAGVRHLLVRTLRSPGYRVIEAADGVEAARLWQEEDRKFDVIARTSKTVSALGGLFGVGLALSLGLLISRNINKTLKGNRPRRPSSFIAG